MALWKPMCQLAVWEPQNLGRTQKSTAPQVVLGTTMFGEIQFARDSAGCRLALAGKLNRVGGFRVGILVTMSPPSQRPTAKCKSPSTTSAKKRAYRGYQWTEGCTKPLTITPYTCFTQGFGATMTRREEAAECGPLSQGTNLETPGRTLRKVKGLQHV